MQLLVLAGLLSGAVFAAGSDAPVVVHPAALVKENLSDAQKLDLAVRKLKKAKTPKEKKALQAKIAALKAAIVRARLREQAEAARLAELASRRTRKAEAFGKSLGEDGGAAAGSQLAQAFDASGKFGGSQDAVQVGALGPALPSPITDAATRKVLVGLSGKRMAVARQAIPLVDRYGEQSGLFNLLRAAGVREPRVFVLAQIRRESAFNPKALGDVGEKGLMQLRPETAHKFLYNEDAIKAAREGYRLAVKNFGAKSPQARNAKIALRELTKPKDLFNMDNNIKAGTAYLTELVTQFGRPDHALFAYNSGAPRTQQTLEEKGRLPRFPQSKEYVKVILGYYSTALGVRRPDFSKTLIVEKYDGDLPSPRTSRRPAER